jgi:hypothetical protein
MHCGFLIADQHNAGLREIAPTDGTRLPIIESGDFGASRFWTALSQTKRLPMSGCYTVLDRVSLVSAPAGGVFIPFA